MYMLTRIGCNALCAVHQFTVRCAVRIACTHPPGGATINACNHATHTPFRAWCWGFGPWWLQAPTQC